MNLSNNVSFDAKPEVVVTSAIEMIISLLDFTETRVSKAINQIETKLIIEKIESEDSEYDMMSLALGLTDVDKVINDLFGDAPADDFHRIELVKQALQSILHIIMMGLLYKTLPAYAFIFRLGDLLSRSGETQEQKSLRNEMTHNIQISDEELPKVLKRLTDLININLERNGKEDYTEEEQEFLNKYIDGGFNYFLKVRDYVKTTHETPTNEDGNEH